MQLRGGCGVAQVCAAVGLCDQSAGSAETSVSKSRRLLADIHPAQSKAGPLGDDTFCQFCTMAVSYIKVQPPIQ